MSSFSYTYSSRIFCVYQKVYSRVRPLSDPDAAKCVRVLSPTTIELTPPEVSRWSKFSSLDVIQNIFNCSLQVSFLNFPVVPYACLALLDKLITIIL